MDDLADEVQPPIQVRLAKAENKIELAFVVNVTLHLRWCFSKVFFHRRQRAGKLCVATNQERKIAHLEVVETFLDVSRIIWCPGYASEACIPSWVDAENKR